MAKVEVVKAVCRACCFASTTQTLARSRLTEEASDVALVQETSRLTFAIRYPRLFTRKLAYSYWDCASGQFHNVAAWVLPTDLVFRIRSCSPARSLKTSHTVILPLRRLRLKKRHDWQTVTLSGRCQINSIPKVSVRI